MKKSLNKAIERAKEESSDGVVYVMDKPKQHAVTCKSGWVKNERILEGWRVVAVFKNGEKVR